ncbi:MULTISPECIES: helicase [Burkholderiaceae]|uniref:helicase n=1 Tax=Burkholderiaceae TaxID=119060 RepID=UPI001420D0D1|nr:MULTISPECIES: helicase [Burkholderiaceae]NIF54069.1 helicase [Burkholderia sp. Ax-1724]NIF81722.1 helicase [Paraburkholderia sp. Cy-641]
MSSRIHGNNGHSNHQADELSQEAHTEQKFEAGTFTRFKVQRVKMQRARMLHNKMAAAFWKGKSFMGANRLPSPSAQKFARLGQRPRPESSGKSHAKDTEIREQPDDGSQLNRYEHEHRRDDDPQKQHQHSHPHEHEREHERERDRDQQQPKQDQGREHERDQQRQDQEPRRERDDGQPQQQQQGQPDGRQPRRDGDKRERSTRIQAAKVGKMRPVRLQALASPMQLLAKEKIGSPDLPSRLAADGTRAALDLLSQIPHDGPLLLVPYLLQMMSPLSMVRRRQPARLQSYHNASLAYAPAVSPKPAVTAKLHALSLDTALARRDAGVDYNDDEQSLAMIRQRILDAVGVAQSTADGTPAASDTTLQVRMPPAAPEAKT